MALLEAYVVPNENDYTVCRHTKPGGGGTQWLCQRCTSHWLPAKRENIRHYSRFKTYDAAFAAAQAHDVTIMRKD